MSQLTTSDLQAAFRFVAELGELRHAAELRSEMLPALRRLVPADSVTYTEIDQRSGEAAWWTDPVDVGECADPEPFAEHLSQHPVAAYHADNSGAEAVQFADFLSERELHRLEIYNDFYRPLEVEHQIAIAIEAPDAVSIPISLQRKRGPFTERTRQMLELIHPHLTNVYDQLDALTRMRQALSALDEATRDGGPALVMLARGDRIDLVTGRGLAWLGDYFEPSQECGADRLPAELADWLDARRHASGAGKDTLLVKRPGRWLTVRYVPGRDPGERDSLVLEEQRTAPDPESLRELGLTGREAEVLSIAAAGATNGDIASELYVSPRTVQMHMRNIFKKLGVHTRTAAVARALGADPPDELAA